MEQQNLFNEFRQPVCVIERGQTVPKGLYRLVVHIAIFNKKGQLLIQQRASTKPTMPNCWDITLGGCQQVGETSKQAIQRELSEELGIDFDFSEEDARFSFNFGRGFDDFYILNLDLNIDDVHFVDGEVQAVKWANIDEIFDMIDKNQFIPYHKSVISLLFEMRNNRNVCKF